LHSVVPLGCQPLGGDLGLKKLCGNGLQPLVWRCRVVVKPRQHAHQTREEVCADRAGGREIGTNPGPMWGPRVPQATFTILRGFLCRVHFCTFVRKVANFYGV
jgi:hypothetical protein